MRTLKWRHALQQNVRMDLVTAAAKRQTHEETAVGFSLRLMIRKFANWKKLCKNARLAKWLLPPRSDLRFKRWQTINVVTVDYLSLSFSYSKIQSSNEVRTWGYRNAKSRIENFAEVLSFDRPRSIRVLANLLIGSYVLATAFFAGREHNN